MYTKSGLFYKKIHFLPFGKLFVFMSVNFDI